MKLLRPIRKAALPLWLCCWLCAGLAIAGLGQAAVGTAGTGEGIGGGYRVGPGDILELTVFSSPELSGLLQVDTHGNIYLPYGTHAIQVAGKSVAQIIPLVARSLVAQKLAINPKVSITVGSVKSRPIVVLGDVRQPITIQAIHPIPLRQALTNASGPGASPGNWVVITSRNPNGGFSTVQLPLQKVLFSNNAKYNPELTGGEDVRITYPSQVYAVGDVRKQGEFPMSNSQHLTALRLIALTGGWLPTASPDSSVIVRSVDGKVIVIPVPMNRILQRRAIDIPLRRNDVLYVPNSTFKTVTLNGLQLAISVLTTATATTLGVLLSTAATTSSSSGKP